MYLNSRTVLTILVYLENAFKIAEAVLIGMYTYRFSRDVSPYFAEHHMGTDQRHAIATQVYLLIYFIVLVWAVCSFFYTLATTFWRSVQVSFGCFEELHRRFPRLYISIYSLVCVLASALHLVMPAMCAVWSFRWYAHFRLNDLGDLAALCRILGIILTVAWSVNVVALVLASYMLYDIFTAWRVNRRGTGGHDRDHDPDHDRAINISLHELICCGISLQVIAYSL